jgi:hypothetical protein
MSVWAWVAVGVAVFLAAGGVVLLAVATILGRIADDVQRLLEHEHWAAAPLTREGQRTDDSARSRRQGHVRSSRTG